MLRLALTSASRCAAAASNAASNAVRNVLSVRSRAIALTAARRETFRVQDEDEFRSKVVENPDPVIVDFQATWCGPCKILGPRLDAAVAATEGQVHLALVDIDDLSDLALEHDVSAVPTVVAMRGGKEVARVVGLVDEDKLGSLVETAKG